MTTENPKNGLHTEYYDNGQKKSEATYKDGVYDGKRAQWYENGQKSSERRNPIQSIYETLQNFWNNNTARDIYNESPTMINEKEYIPKNCVFCNVRMESIHDTHNPYPAAPFMYAKESNLTNKPDRCCTSCVRNVVSPAREKRNTPQPRIKKENNY